MRSKIEAGNYLLDIIVGERTRETNRRQQSLPVTYIKLSNPRNPTGNLRFLYWEQWVSALCAQRKNSSHPWLTHKSTLTAIINGRHIRFSLWFKLHKISVWILYLRRSEKNTTTRMDAIPILFTAVTKLEFLWQIRLAV